MIKKKLFIFSLISSIIAFVFCIFNISSYAYQTNSNFTNTIDSIVNESNNSTLDLESQTFYGSNRYKLFLNEGIYKGQYLCVNFYIDNSVNINTITFTFTQNTLSSINTFPYYLYKGLNNSYSILISLNNSYVYSSTQDTLYDYLRFGFNSNIILRIDNIDIIENIDVYTSFYFEIYQNQLDELQSLYDDLENDYSTLEGQYDDLEDDYSDLNNLYNSLKNSYDAISVNLNPFQLDNISSFNMYLNDMLLDEGYQKFDGNSVSFDFYSMYYEDYWDQNNNNYFRIQVNLDGYSSFNAFESKDSLSDFYGESVSMYFYNNSTQVDYWLQSDTDRNDDNITKFYTYGYSFNSYTIFFDLKPTQQEGGYTHRISLLNTYDIGYSNGYKDGNNNGYVNGYNQGVTDSDNNLRDAYNDGYADGYKVYSDYLEDGTTYETILISLATGPINIFKQIFNFEVLGANISILITSVITLLITIWVIKRFLK